MAGLKVHGFLEGALLELRQPLPGQQWRFTPLGTGVGLRLKGKPYGSLALDIGVPLRPIGNTARGDLRVHFSASAEF